MLMDDVLVNFDPNRASLAAQGIQEMAESRQVLFFTCHPETVQVFRCHAPDVAVYQIAGGTVRPDVQGGRSRIRGSPKGRPVRPPASI